MQNVPDTTNTVQFDTALRTLAAAARTRYAGEAARLDRGLCLALNGHVTLHADGTASVRSGSDAEVVYTVNGHCDCPDASRAPEGRCKHRWAKCLVKRATQQKAEEQAAQKYYATYNTPDGLVLQGTAEWMPSEGGWLVIDEVTNYAYLTRRAHALVLGGRVDILEAQRAADGDLVHKVCGYGKGR